MTAPSLPLYTLLRMALPGKMIWLAGSEADATNTPVGWIVLDPQLASGGEAYLLDAAELTPIGVSEAQSRGVIAIIALGKATYPARFKDFSIPIVCLPGTTDLNVSHRHLLTSLVNERAYLMERGNEIQARLTQLAAEGTGLEGVVSAIAEISGLGVFVQDKRMDLLASCCPKILDSDWDNVLSQVKTVSSLPEVLQDRKRAGQQSDLLTQALDGEYERLITSINVGGMARGYLSMVGKIGEIDALSRIVAEQGAVVCAVEMSRSKAVREMEKRLKGDLLTALLKGDLSPGDVRLWTDRIGVDLEQHHACLRFCWDSLEPPSLRRLETLVNSEVSKQNYKVFVSMLEDEVICFIEVKSGETRPDHVFALGRSVIDRAMLNFPDSDPRCGIGIPVDSFENWRVSFRQAGQALKMAKRLFETKPLFFPDLSVYRLLLQIEGNPELTAFQDEILGPLLSYDNGVELIRTLEAYFGRNGNLKKTANALFIHRNTLIYRLERIQEITGLDLSNPETRLALQLTLHIHKMLGERERYPENR